MTNQQPPTPGNPEPYTLGHVVPTARPADLPTALWRLDLEPGVRLRPRVSQGWTRVGGKNRRYYWCLACNRCLRHWRTAFCDQHLASYKRLRRRAREGTNEHVRLPRHLVAHLVDSAHATMAARSQANSRPDVELKREANRKMHNLLSLIINEFDDYG